MADCLSEFFEDPEFRSTNLTGAASPENLFSMLETLEDASKDIIPFTPFDEPIFSPRDGDHTNSNNRPHETDEDDEEASLARKKLKFAVAAQDGQPKISHITVERNRRKQMNDNLCVLRSLMPCFYVKRGDQASIIGGVVDYIKELQQVLQSLEAKKQRKVYSEVLSPRALASSPRPPPMSPIRPSPLSPRPSSMSPIRPSPLSPRPGMPISPRTPQPGSPYKRRAAPPPSSPSLDITAGSSCSEPPAANSKSPVADVEVKFSGPNVLLNTMSHRIPGQATKIIAALEGHALEILQVNINTLDKTMLNSFTIKIGIECELSAEELAEEIQQTFSS